MVWLKQGRLSLLLVGFGLAPLLFIFSRMLWSRPAYQFFPLALVAAAMLAYRACRESDGTAQPGSRRTAQILAGLTLLFFLVWNALWSPWLGMITLLLTLVTAVWSCAGRKGLRATVPVLLVLLIITPPPLGLDTRLTLGLRSAAVKMSGCLLDFLRVNHVLEGNTIRLPGKALLVAEACSGINSVMFCSAFCLFWTLWRRRPLYWLLIGIPVTCLLVTLGNTFRITVGAAVSFYRQVDLLSGWRHETFGVLLLLAYCGLILSVDQLMLFLTRRPVSENKVPPAVANSSDFPPKQAAAALPPIFDLRFVGWVMASVSLVVLALGIGLGDVRSVLAKPNPGKPRELTLTLPANLAGWQRVDTKGDSSAVVETVGVRSTQWRFQRAGQQAVVAVDYPLLGFHNVKLCYIACGWRVVKEEQLASPADLGEKLAIKATLKNSAGQNAVVFHAVINEHGQWLSASVWKRILPARIVGWDAVMSEPSYRIQVLTGGYMPLSDTMVAEVQELFSAASQALSQQLLDQFPKSHSQ